ncbi:MAG: hypothetical protein V1720_22245 [bacterium]
MDSKKIKIALLALALLAGCLNYEQITTIKTDGSGDMYIHYWMHWRNDRDTTTINQLGLFNQDSIRSEFSSLYNTMDNIEVYNDFSDSTIHAKIEITFNSFDSLNYTKAFKGANFSIKNGPNNTRIFSQFIKPFATGFGFESNALNITHVYYLPGEITFHNANSLTRNKLTWEYTLAEIGTGKTITATYRPYKLKETPKWIYYSALTILVVVIVYLFRKRKK